MNTSGHTINTSGDIMSISGDIRYIRGIPSCMLGDILIHVVGYYEFIRDVQYIGVFNIHQRLFSVCSPT